MILTAVAMKVLVSAMKFLVDEVNLMEMLLEKVFTEY